MAANKIIINGEVKMDLTSDTVTADDLAYGVTAHSASGDAVVGLSPKTWTGTKAQYEAQKNDIPVGTIVNITDDYSGGGSFANIYSEEEVLIGKFFDKNLYRRCIPFNKSVSNSMVITTYIPEAARIIVNANVIRFHETNLQRNCNNPVTIWYNSGWKLQGVDTMTYQTGDIQYLVIEYTKVGE